MVKIKDENVDILAMRYIEKTDEYVIVFQIKNLTSEERQKIKKKCDLGFLQALDSNLNAIIEINDNLYIEERYESKYMNHHRSLIPLAKNYNVPKRLDPGKIEVESDLCRIEENMAFRLFCDEIEI